jgi:HSP20 family protein
MNTIVKCGYRPMFPTFFDEVFEQAANKVNYNYYKPAANIKEDESSFNVELALPGFDKAEISMKLEKNVLTISAGLDEKESEKDKGYSWHEFRKTGKYQRSFIVPESVNTDEIKAENINGILYVTLPKKEVLPIVNREITIG